jgi:hypothetical protein
MAEISLPYSCRQEDLSSTLGIRTSKSFPELIFFMICSLVSRGMV